MLYFERTVEKRKQNGIFWKDNKFLSRKVLKAYNSHTAKGSKF